MPRIYILALIILMPILLFSYSWTYKFETPVYSKDQLSIKDCVLNQKPFEPEIPVKPVMLLLPYNTEAQSIKIIYSEPIEMSETLIIKPVSPSGRLSINPPHKPLLHSPVYEENQFYPELSYEGKFVNQTKNGHNLLITFIYPIQYNPVTQKIRYYNEITIQVETQYKPSELYKHNNSIVKNLDTLIDNKSILATFPVTQRTINDYDYLIITSETYQEEFQAMINFNLSRCLKTKLTTLEYIINNIEGEDTPDKIRNYIRAEYIQHGLTYVLLGGDDEIIPHRGFRTEINDYGYDYYDEQDMPADMYYSCLDGTWKLAGSQFYGESGSEDLLFEVYTSRFTIASPEELSAMINKTISYSNTPVVESLQNNLLVGEFLWGPPEFEILTYGQMYMDEFVGHCTANNYNTDGFNEFWTNQTLYDNTNNWTGEDLMNSVNQNSTFWIDHLGHSNVTYNMKLANPDVNNTNFQNNGTNSNFFIVYSQGCYSGSFDNRTSNGQILDTDCIGEKFVTITNGALAYIGNARYGLGSPYDTNGSGQVFHRYFHHALFNKNIYEIEKMNAYSKEISAPFILEADITLAPYYGQCKWIAYGLNIFGDPALSIWRDSPLQLDPILADTLYMNSDFIIQSEPYTRIALFNTDHSFLYTTTTDSTGYYNLSEQNEIMNYISNHVSESYIINLKAENYYSYSKALQINCVSNIDQIINKPLEYISIYPNPFNPTTHVKWSNRADGRVKIDIYNIKGQLINTLTDKSYRAGIHQITWNGLSKKNERLSSGIYFIKIKQNDQSMMKKVLLLK